MLYLKMLKQSCNDHREKDDLNESNENSEYNEKPDLNEQVLLVQNLMEMI